MNGGLEAIKALVVDVRTDAAHAFASVLRGDLACEIDFTNSTHKAIQSLYETAYDICFLSDAYSLDELQSFLRDVGKIKREKDCLIVQLREHIESDLDRASLKELGIAFIMSRQGTHADRVGLRQAVTDLLYARTLQQKVSSVNDTMSMVLAEIDRAAEDQKRGRKSQVNKLPISFVDYQTDFDDRVLDSYYDALSTETDQASPNNIASLDVPEGVLARHLPRLSKGTYDGVSHRVWRKLKKRYGKAAPTPADDPDEEL